MSLSRAGLDSDAPRNSSSNARRSSRVMEVHSILAEQQAMMERVDNELDEVSKSVRSLKEMSLALGGELDETNMLLDGLDGDMAFDGRSYADDDYDRLGPARFRANRMPAKDALAPKSGKKKEAKRRNLAPKRDEPLRNYKQAQAPTMAAPAPKPAPSSTVSRHALSWADDSILPVAASGPPPPPPPGDNAMLDLLSSRLMDQSEQLDYMCADLSLQAATFKSSARTLRKKKAAFALPSFSLPIGGRSAAKSFGKRGAMMAEYEPLERPKVPAAPQPDLDDLFAELALVNEPESGGACSKGRRRKRRRRKRMIKKKARRRRTKWMDAEE